MFGDPYEVPDTDDDGPDFVGFESDDEGYPSEDETFPDTDDD